MPDNAEAAAAHRPPGIRLFTPPPAGFDPVRATDRELLAHGYPARPDPERQPELHKHWNAMLSRPITVIRPEFDEAPPRLGGKRLRYADTVGSPWAGSQFIVSEGADPVQFVTGQWTVPAVAVPEGDHGTSSCATWIGIDGGPFSGADGFILQTGTTQQITYGDSTSTFAWFEWFPVPPCTLSNLAVSPGDVMYGLICIDTSSEARIYLGNMTTGQLVSFVKDGSSEGLSVEGQSAEWILECPTDLKSGDFDLLTKFGDIYFDNCLAGTNGPDGPQTVLGGGYANLIMEGTADGNFFPIAAPLSLNDRAFKVQYVVPP
jgi:hypothetical protein